MSRKTNAVAALAEYFAMKGRLMDFREYAKQPDKPVSVQAVKRVCGSWTRTLALMERAHPDKMAIAKASFTEAETSKYDFVEEVVEEPKVLPKISTKKHLPKEDSVDE
jgi:hypothetical protein